jgi:hypothetical protein
MTAIDKNLHAPTPAPHSPFTPTSAIPRSTVQAAVGYVQAEAAAAAADVAGDLADHIADASAAHAASAISFSATGGIAATNAQTAIAELDTEKLAASSYTAADVLSKLLTVDGASSGLDADLLDGNSSAFYSPATVSGTAAAILASLLTVDGSGSALDADLLDGLNSAAFALDTEVRERLTAARTYYVATTGSDSNDGLTALTPFLTGQKAADVIRDTLDLVGYAVTVQFADGTYADAILCNRPWTGQGTGGVTFTGNTGTPANVIFSTTSANCVSAVRGARISVTGMELRTTTSGYCLDAGAAGAIGVLTAVRFGAAASGHIVSDSGGLVLLNNSYSIVGSAPFHILCFSGGHVESLSVTVTITGTPAFSTAYAQVYRGGSATLASNTYSGSATGVRFIVASGGSIMTSDAGLTALPGNAAGQILGGFYDNFGGANHVWFADGITAPSATSGFAKLYVDTADGDLKVIFGDGTVKTIATDT